MPRICIAGKGGTGKSVLTTLLAKVFGEMGHPVLILDSDESNPGLYRMLGFRQAPSDLIGFFGGPRRVMEWSGEEARVEGSGGEKLRIQDIPGRYLIGADTFKLASVGKITGAFEGCACPMAEVLKAFLTRLSLAENEIVLVDMEAGVEHFGRGVEKRVEAVVIVVEPSFESIALAGKINLLAQASGVQQIGAVVNKVHSPEIGRRLTEELGKRKISVLGLIPYDEQIAQDCLEGKVVDGNAVRQSFRNISRDLLEVFPTVH
jgi:CO dehydrogenase maturation factor